jgi:hypothetical protein
MGDINPAEARAIRYDRLDDLLAWVVQNPDEHRQDTWGSRSATCGTAYCIAGHAVARMEDAGLGIMVWSALCDDDDCDCGGASDLHSFHYAATPTDPHGVTDTVAAAAREWLGLGFRTGKNLFDAHNTQADLIAWRDYYAVQAGLPLYAGPRPTPDSDQAKIQVTEFMSW